MCGIFGIIAKEDKYSKFVLLKVLEDLAKLSQVRGKDSSGLAYRFELEKKIEVLRGPVSIDLLLKTDEYKNLKSRIRNEIKEGTNKIFTVLGHARLVTNGSQLKDVNNQPLVKDGIVGVHNGIIVNENELWNKNDEIKKEFDIDTEIIFSLIRKYLNLNYSLAHSMALLSKELSGTISTGFMLNDLEEFVVFTNNGSLYILTNSKDILIYGSEKFILQELLSKNAELFSKGFELKQVHANKGYVIKYVDFFIQEFDLAMSTNINSVDSRCNSFEIKVRNYHPLKKQIDAVIDSSQFTNIVTSNSDRKLLEYNIERISKLRRCKKCLLPETFPFIQYDDSGTCNICNNYEKKNTTRSLKELEELVAPYWRKDGQPDCLIPFSGGRDSTYTLHVVKNILKMNPISFTYDWGMVTDLGRRNIARVTGKLGVENIIISANIHWKRENIRKNISAWLKNPELGMIPLFMAGDKFFFYYTEKVKKQNNIKLNIWGINPLENTDFKVGFCGVPLNFNKKRIYSLALLDQVRLLGYVGKNVFKSPSYLNQSIFDSIGSIASRYFVKKEDYYHLFDYVEWDEKEIEDLIVNEYKWETAIDTKTTWRIGDGTAGFYNYIYYTVAGFSEYDTFRSNQIREGMLNREKALKLVNEENKPRYESLKWYLEIVGLEYDNVIKTINKIPKLY